MEALARLAGIRPVAVTVSAVVIVVLGYVSWNDLPLDLFPDIQSPTVLISVSSGDRPAVEMERLYGQRIEQLLFTVQGLSSIDQVARSGRLITRVSFNWQADVDLALVEVNRAVASIKSDTDVDDVRVRRFDPRQLPVLTLGLTAADNRPDLSELRRIARRQIAPTLEQLEGVAEVRVSGGRVKQVQVQIDPTRLQAYDLTIDQVRNRISASNADINAGSLLDGDRVLLVRGLSRFIAAEDIGQVVVEYVSNNAGAFTPVRVNDIANVVTTDAEFTNMVRVNGVEGVGLFVYKEAGANTVAVSRVVNASIAGLANDLPGISAAVITDEAALVEDAISGVQSAAIFGILLSIGVLILFLRSPGPIVIVAVAVPVSLFAAVFAMSVAGHSLNLMTLGGLALGAGMLVDNAIVVIESIFRRRAAGDAPLQAAAKGTGIVGGAIVASTLTTCVVFLPVLFIEGMASKLVSGISFTVVVSLLASLLVAIFLIPALSIWLLPKKHTEDVDPGSKRLEKWVYNLLGRPWPIVLFSFLLAGFAINALMSLGNELLPPSDPRQISLRVSGPPGQRVESTAVTVANIEAIIHAASGENIAATLSEVGRLDDNDRVIRETQNEENTAEILVRLGTGEHSASQVIDSAAASVDALFGTSVDWQVSNSALSQALGTNGPAIAIEVSGRSLEDIRFGAEVVQRELEQQAALWNVRTSFEGAPPEMLLSLNRAVAEGLGVDLAAISDVLEAALDGLSVTTLSLGDEDREIVIALPEINTAEILAQQFRTSGGQLLTIGDVARLERAPGAREIYRRDQRRIAQITAAVSPGFSNPEARAAAVSALAQAELPAGIVAQMSGEELERQRTVTELSWAAALAFMLVLMVLAGSFESLLHPLTILTAIPVSLIGVAAVLVPLGQPLGIMAMLGFIMLVGIAVNDAILIAQMARGLIIDGMERRQALARAASLRLRPIIMTTATTVLALLPMAIGSGEGAELRSPLAATVVGGIIASTIGSLTVVPCLYLILDRLRFSFSSTDAESDGTQSPTQPASDSIKAS